MVDINLNEEGINQLEQTNELKNLLDQLEVLLFTQPGDIYGDPDFGVNYKQFLFELGFSNYEVQKYIKRQISRYILWSKYFKIDVFVKLIPGEINDMAFVNVTVDGISVIGVHIK